MTNPLFSVAKKTLHEGGDSPDQIGIVARMSHLTVFCIDSAAIVAAVTKTVCHRQAGSRRSVQDGGTTNVARAFVAGGKG